jgi:hypothetical protein
MIRPTRITIAPTSLTIPPTSIVSLLRVFVSRILADDARDVLVVLVAAGTSVKQRARQGLYARSSREGVKSQLRQGD